MNSIENMERTDNTPSAASKQEEDTPTDTPSPTETDTALSVLPARSGDALPVLLTIHSEQDIDTPQQDHMELLTEGTMNLTPDCLTLTYHESALTGMEGTTTVFEMYGPKLIIGRLCCLF